MVFASSEEIRRGTPPSSPKDDQMTHDRVVVQKWLNFLTLYLKNRKIQGVQSTERSRNSDRLQGPTQAAARQRSPRSVCQHAWTLDALVAAGMLARGNRCLSASVAFSLERCSSPGGLGSAQAFACVACELRTTTRIAGSFLNVGETRTVADDRDSVPVRWEQKGGQLTAAGGSGWIRPP